MSQILTAIIDTQKASYRSIGQVNAADDLELELEVKMNGKPIEFINPECELLIKKSDKNKVRQLKDIRYEDGKFRIKVDEQGVAYPGITTNQLIIKDSGRISTVLFYFQVGTSLDREIIQSISKIEVLEQLDEYVVTAFANLDEYEKRIIAGDSAIRKLNDDMIAAEKVRDAAEAKRQKNYNTAEASREELYSNSELTRNNNYRNAEADRDRSYSEAEANRNNLFNNCKAEMDAATQNSKNEENRRSNTFSNLRTEIQALKTQMEQNESGRVAAEETRVNEFNTMKSENENFKQEINEQYEQINTKVISVEERVQAIEDEENTAIDDTTISKDKTWSSEKIEDSILTNSDVVWSDIQGENLSVEFTKEGHLREVEIWGNTWQDDTDSKNLFGKNVVTNHGASMKNITWSDDNNVSFDMNTQTWNGFELILDSTKTYTLSLNFTTSTIEGEPASLRLYGDGINHPLTNGSINRVKYTFSNTSYIRICGISTLGVVNHIEFKDVQIEEGSVATDYVDYHKADLSNIKHLGELYVDEEGNPILDSEGREQYKIEIESRNTLLNWSEFAKAGGFEEDDNYVYIKGNTNFTLNLDLQTNTQFTFFVDGEITKSDNFGLFKFDYFDSELSDATYMKVGKVSLLRGKKLKQVTWSNAFNAESKIDKRKSYLINCDEDNLIPNSYKTTILLPCQLCKVGDVADRLYWDSENGKYVVEKNIVNETYKDKTGWGVWYHSEPILRFMITPTNTPVNSSSLKVLTNKILSVGYNINQKNIYIANGKLFLILNDNDLTSNDLNGLNDWLLNETLNVYYQSATPQLIETTILEEIKQPTYKDLTHFFVTGNLDGTLKAKAPLDGGQAIQTLSARNLSLNKEVSTLSLENEEIKEVNNTQDILIDTTMMATDEVYTMLEPILEMMPMTMSIDGEMKGGSSKMVDMYVAMVQRGLKTIEQVPARYREEVTEILAKLEK